MPLISTGPVPLVSTSPVPPVSAGPVALPGGKLLRHPYQDLEAVQIFTPSASRIFPTVEGKSTQTWAGFPLLGETLEYDISWGLMTVGHAWLKVDKLVMIDGKPVYHITSRSKSAAFINNFFRVDDINEAWLDPETLKSFGYYKKIQEGGYFYNEWVLFDTPSKIFRGERMNRKREITKFDGPLEGPVNDVLSAMYAVRVMELKTGSALEIKVNTRRNWAMTVKVLRAEKAKTDYGKFKCYVVEPRVGDEGIFVPKKGKRMFVWLTDDNLRLPLILKAEIFIGSVTAKLVKRTVDQPELKR